MTVQEIDADEKDRLKQLRLALGRDDDIAGFEIAMGDAGVMGRLHARGDLLKK